MEREISHPCRCAAGSSRALPASRETELVRLLSSVDVTGDCVTAVLSQSHCDASLVIISAPPSLSRFYVCFINSLLIVWAPTSICRSQCEYDGCDSSHDPTNTLFFFFVFHLCGTVPATNDFISSHDDKIYLLFKANIRVLKVDPTIMFLIYLFH